MDPKRPAEDEAVAGHEAPPAKKARGGAAEMRKVAEIVMVLSALAEMRGGRTPTEAEVEMMVAAREKLAAVCESLAPKDLVAREAIGALIEDLGLNNSVKEQKLGYRPPRVSISEKVLQTKKKMEEVSDFNAQAQQRLSAAGEVRGTLGTVHSSSANKPHSVVAGSLPTASTFGHGHVSGPTVPKTERPHFGGPRSVQGDHGQMNAPTWSVQPQTLSFSKHGTEHKVAPRIDGAASRMNPQAAKDQIPRPYVTQISKQHPGTAIGQGLPSANSHNEILKIVHKLLQKQFPERPIWTPPSRDYMNKAVTCHVCHLSVHDVDSVFLCDACEKAYHFKCLQSPSQKVIPRGEWHCPGCLHLSNGKPLPPKYGRVTRNVGTPKAPSKVAGFQASSDQKGITQKGRTVGPQTGITSSGSFSSNNSDRRELQGNNTSSSLKITLGKSSSGTILNNPVNISGESSQGLAGSTGTRSSQDLHVPGPSLQGQSMKSTPQPQAMLSNTTNVFSGRDLVSNGLPMQESSFKLSYAGQESSANDLLKPGSVAKLDQVADALGFEQSINNFRKSDSMIKPSNSESHVLDNNLVADSSKVIEADLKTITGFTGKEPSTSEPNCAAKLSPTIAENAASNSESVSNNVLDVSGGVKNPAEGQGSTRHNKESIMPHVGEKEDTSLMSVQWKGDVLEAVNEKQYFKSCCIDGVTYELHDRALFEFNGKLVPVKLQAMWEVKETREKWFLISQYYFPWDLPEAVVRPSAPQDNEVYESDRESPIMAGLIKGPCKVLPPEEFKKQSDKRTQLGTESDGRDPHYPIYSCNWRYDESKGIFLMATS